MILVQSPGSISWIITSLLGLSSSWVYSNWTAAAPCAVELPRMVITLPVCATLIGKM